jgi:hypothetical protein
MMATRVNNKVATLMVLLRPTIAMNQQPSQNTCQLKVQPPIAGVPIRTASIINQVRTAYMGLRWPGPVWVGILLLFYYLI